MRWPKLREVIARDLKHVSEETRACLLRENVRELYRLPALTSLPAWGLKWGYLVADRRSVCLRSPRWKRNRAASLRLSVGDAKGCARDWGKTGPATIFL
jgi:hypothetical protein